MYKTIKTFRSALLVYLTHKLALPVLKLIRRPVKFPYTATELAQMPAGTMGHTLINFLEEKDLHLLPYYAKHDIKHILLNYDTTDEGEVCLQCFMLGNRHVSFPVVATVLYGLVTMPEYWSSFKKAYRRGKQYKPIEGWKWFELLQIPVADLQGNMQLKNT